MNNSRGNQYSLNSGNKGNKNNIAIIISIVVVLVIAALVWMNFPRIRMMIKGYSFEQQAVVLKLEKADRKEILSHDKMENILDWINVSTRTSYYDEYQRYYELHSDLEFSEVASIIDEVFDESIETLTAKGYSDDQIWKMLETGVAKDFKYVAEKGYTYAQMEPYMNVKGFAFTDMEAYMSAYPQYNNYNYTVLITTYPFIISSNTASVSYTILDPENILALVKRGFGLPSDYEPTDLVHPNIPFADDDDDKYLRKEAAEALEQMAADAKVLGYNLVLNSAYRSYAAQAAIYKQYEDRWGGIYAREHVANPGESEHQTGLGIDLTSQSVLDGERMVFGDTAEFKWCRDNAYKYGYILRFIEGTSETTGIVQEPWHFRYVGKAAAQKIYENSWTLEEYVLNEGLLPDLKKN